MTPPSWANEVAETLANATVVEVEGFAHSPTFASECTATIGLQFYHDPSSALDTTCLAEVKLNFLVPD